MNAQEIMTLANEYGTDSIIRELGVSRRQAESLVTVARRHVHEGRGNRELPTDVATRRYDQRPPMPGRALNDAEVAEHAARIIPPTLIGLTAEEYHAHQAAELERLRRERNAEQGHPERGPVPIGFETHDERGKRLKERV